MSAYERMTVTLGYDAVAGRWSIVGVPPGPAGCVDLRLADEVEILVDTVEPQRLVELTGTLPDLKPLPPATGRLVAALLGKRVATLLTEAVAQPKPEVRIVCEFTTALRAVGRLVLLDHLRAAGDSVSPWWAAEAALLANEVDLREFRSYASHEASQAAPMLAAVTRIPDSALREFGGVVTHRLKQLARAVSELLLGSIASGRRAGCQRATRPCVVAAHQAP